MNPAAGRVPAMDRNVSIPMSSSIWGMRSEVRWSAQVMARPSG